MHLQHITVSRAAGTVKPPQSGRLLVLAGLPVIIRRSIISEPTLRCENGPADSGEVSPKHVEPLQMERNEETLNVVFDSFYPPKHPKGKA